MLKRALFLLSLLAPLVCSAQPRGLVTSSPCPYSCRTQNIPKSHCRDWREGNTCYIEDLSKPPAPPRPADREPGWDRPPSRGYEGEGRQQCRRSAGDYMARPRISIYRVHKTGNFFGSEYKVEGTIEGVCLVEAGYFERGRPRQRIPIETTRDFRRFDFEVRARGDQEPEIRAYNVNGDSDEVRIESSREGNRGFDYGDYGGRDRSRGGW